jgi:hypothetical protein
VKNSESSLAALKRPSVIILSDNAEFADPIIARWGMERIAPEIKVVSRDCWHSSMAFAHDLIVIHSLPVDDHLPIFTALRDAAGKPVICVIPQQSRLREMMLSYANLLVIEQLDDWVTNLVLLGGEILRRIEALGRAHRAEKSASDSHRYAILGRYMLDMRPGVNDALTSILGNADLLLLDPAQDAPSVREQIKTIHHMSLRLNEIMQRFSSLAAEMHATSEEFSSRLAPATVGCSPKAQPTS